MDDSCVTRPDVEGVPWHDDLSRLSVPLTLAWHSDLDGGALVPLPFPIAR